MLSRASRAPHGRRSRAPCRRRIGDRIRSVVCGALSRGTPLPMHHRTERPDRNGHRWEWERLKLARRRERRPDAFLLYWTRHRVRSPPSQSASAHEARQLLSSRVTYANAYELIHHGAEVAAPETSCFMEPARCGWTAGRFSLLCATPCTYSAAYSHPRACLTILRTVWLLQSRHTNPLRPHGGTNGEWLCCCCCCCFE